MCVAKFSVQLFSYRFDGWGTHDCERTEAAGVICKPKPPTTTPPPPTTTPRWLWHGYQVSNQRVVSVLTQDQLTRAKGGDTSFAFLRCHHL